MGFKRKLMGVVFLVTVLSAVFFMVCNITLKKEVNYCDKLISILNEHDETMVQNVFTFQFEKAYVFNDCYISGEGFAQKYNLDISINEVKSGVSENIQRIVFVDKSNNFVYEFRCDDSKVFFLEEGMILYPQTIIKRESSSQQKPIIIDFQSSEMYD